MSSTEHGLLTTAWVQLQLVKSYVDAGLAEGTNDNTTTAAKTVGTSGGIFEGVNVNCV